MSPIRRLLLASALAGSALLPTVALTQTPPAATPAPATPAPATPVAPQATPAPTPPPLPVVNGVPLTERDVEVAQSELGEALEQIPEPQRRQQLVDYLVTVRVLAAQARSENLADGPDFAARQQYLIDKSLMEAFLRREVAKAVTPEAIEAFYKERIASVPPEIEVHARHILVKTEDEAKAIIAELKAGKDFAALAKEKSEDPGSKDEGGDLGFFTRDRMVPEFAAAAFALEPGKFTETPVKSQFGWHVIRVEEKRPQAVPTLAEVSEQIKSFLARQAQGAAIQRVRAAAKIEQSH